MNDTKRFLEIEQLDIQIHFITETTWNKTYVIQSSIIATRAKGGTIASQLIGRTLMQNKGQISTGLNKSFQTLMIKSPYFNVMVLISTFRINK